MFILRVRVKRRSSEAIIQIWFTKRFLQRGPIRHWSLSSGRGAVIFLVFLLNLFFFFCKFDVRCDRSPTMQN